MTHAGALIALAIYILSGWMIFGCVRRVEKIKAHVIEANGGELIERFHKPAEYGGAESLRFRITLAQAAA